MRKYNWIPAFAGMTKGRGNDRECATYVVVYIKKLRRLIGDLMLNDFFSLLNRLNCIPITLWINNNGGAMLARTQATCLINANAFKAKFLNPCLHIIQDFVRPF